MESWYGHRDTFHANPFWRGNHFRVICKQCIPHFFLEGKPFLGHMQIVNTPFLFGGETIFRSYANSEYPISFWRETILGHMQIVNTQFLFGGEPFWVICKQCVPSFFLEGNHFWVIRKKCIPHFFLEGKPFLGHMQVVHTPFLFGGETIFGSYASSEYPISFWRGNHFWVIYKQFIPSFFLEGKTSFGSYANSAYPVFFLEGKPFLGAASDQGLHCLLTGISMQNTNKVKTFTTEKPLKLERNSNK